MGQAKTRKLNGTYGTPKVSPLNPVPVPAPSIVWHYTVGAAIERILADGKLNLGLLARRYSVLWFSANPVWELSAGKRIGNLHLDKTGTENYYGGLYRIGVSPSGLTAWNEWKAALRPNPQSLVEFERYGNPSEWWCSFGVVERNRWKTVERLIDNKWQALFQHDVILPAIVKTQEIAPPGREEVAGFWNFWESRVST
jgi:hypothetical protein